MFLFNFLWIIKPIILCCENQVPLKPMLVRGVQGGGGGGGRVEVRVCSCHMKGLNNK